MTSSTGPTLTMRPVCSSAALLQRRRMVSTSCDAITRMCELLIISFSRAVAFTTKAASPAPISSSMMRISGMTAVVTANASRSSMPVE